MEHNIATAIVGSMKTHARKPADFYPSPPDVTQVLLDHIAIPSDTTIWEPACGDGAMSRILEANGFAVWSSDLRENSGYGIGGSDFLNTDPGFDPDWIITNPPFKVAAAFIERALAITPNVAMLLKSQFWHARSRIELFERHVPAAILPLTWRPSFLEAERGSSPLMDVIWVVWQDGDRSARYVPLRRPTSIPTTLCDELAALLSAPHADEIDVLLSTYVQRINRDHNDVSRVFTNSLNDITKNALTSTHMEAPGGDLTPNSDDFDLFDEALRVDAATIMP